jgi:amidohydrolase
MLKQAQELQSQLVAWRRDLHMHPELGFQETRTAAVVAEALGKLGYRVRSGVGRTGVLGELGQGRPVVAIRADMDALPIQEANPVPYASTLPGVMHACGHDAHVAMALGAAQLLAGASWPGTVRFLFQPSEEAGDAEGLSGAPRMIEDGAMQGVDFVIAQHVDTDTPVGTIRIDAGPASGGVDSFFGQVIGRGAHGARPHEAIDPFCLAAHVILALNTIVSRHLSPFDPAVVSLGSIHGGHTQNVIPDQIDLTGTLRYTESRVQNQIHAEIERAFQVTRALGGDYKLRFERGSLPMMNHPDAVELIRNVAGDVLGPEHVLSMEKDLGAEDFATFLAAAPGAMFLLGARRTGDERLAHNPRFDIDEAALPVGTAILAASALRLLNNPC